jgi:hypothetical protein
MSERETAVELPFAADCCPCLDKLRTVLPFTVGIRDGVVHLVSTLGSAVGSARAEHTGGWGTPLPSNHSRGAKPGGAITVLNQSAGAGCLAPAEFVLRRDGNYFSIDRSRGARSLPRCIRFGITTWRSTFTMGWIWCTRTSARTPRRWASHPKTTSRGIPLDSHPWSAPSSRLRCASASTPASPHSRSLVTW